MARLPRIYVEGVLYYVTSRGGHNQAIFKTPADYIEYIGLISKYKAQYGFKLFAFALLPTHLHMLIELKNNIGISNIMHDINSLYTKMFNSKYNTKGHLFEARFKTAFAEKEGLLPELVRHIHLNAQRERIVYDPKDYPFSSHEKYMDASKRQGPDMAEEIEEVLGANGRSPLQGEREETFEAFVKGASKKEMNEMKKRLTKRVLGTKAFVDRIKKVMAKSANESYPTKRLARVHKMYITTSAVMMFVVVMAAGIFTMKHTELVSEYDQTLEIYGRTLKMLETAQAKAIGANESVEDYEWKIRVAEEAIAGLKREREDALRQARELEGRSLIVALKQIGGPKDAFASADILTFRDFRVSSDNLEKEGFAGSQYSRREVSGGKVSWETMQKNDRGETASWRGEWDGKMMKGVVSIRSKNGAIKDYSFVASSRRQEK